jgi:colicin import membrane protein
LGKSQRSRASLDRTEGSRPEAFAPEGAALMPRKLKTYQTSLGFFDLAIAAPSMKAALEAWGSKANLFHQGFAKEADDPVIVAATMAKPGVVLRRAVGSKANFTENAAPPTDLTGGKASGTGKRAPKSPPPPRKVDDKAAHAAAIAYARDQKRRDSDRRRQEAAQEAERERRKQARAKAESALKEAKQIHNIKTDEIAAERSALDRRSEAEEIRWDKQRADLEAALKQAQE